MAPFAAWPSGEALKYVLLSDAKKDLEQTLSKSFLDCKHSIAGRGVSWASDEVLVANIMDLLNLTQTLEELKVNFCNKKHVVIFSRKPSKPSHFRTSDTFRSFEPILRQNYHWIMLTIPITMLVGEAGTHSMLVHLLLYFPARRLS